MADSDLEVVDNETVEVVVSKETTVEVADTGIPAASIQDSPVTSACLAADTIRTALDELCDRVAQLENLHEDWRTPTGFKDPHTDVIVTYDELTRTLTLAPQNLSYEFYHEGLHHEVSETLQAQHPDVEGKYGFFIGHDHDLETFWLDYRAVDTVEQLLQLHDQEIIIGTVYWNDVEKRTEGWCSDVHHLLAVEVAKFMHDVHGLVYLYGMDPGDYVLDGDGSLDSHCQLSVTEGVVRNEDVRIYVLNTGSPIPEGEFGINQTISPVLFAPVYFSYGPDGVVRHKDADHFPVIYPGSTPYYVGAGRCAYNEWTGATWQLTEVTNGRYFLIHAFACMNDLAPVVIRLGTAQYNTAEAALLGAEGELEQLASQRMTTYEATPLFSMAVQTSSTYTNTPNARFRGIG